MALAIFDARPERVQVGELFDTNKRYVYRDQTGGINPSLVKYATSPTVVGQGNKLTYSFDGVVFWVNQQLPITPTFFVIGVT
jgi:hypothetical protein